MSTPTTVSVLPFPRSLAMCPKCSNTTLYRWYEATLDVLVFDCTGDRGCGHRFATYPQDAPPRSKDDDSVHTVELPAVELPDETDDEADEDEDETDDEAGTVT